VRKIQQNVINLNILFPTEMEQYKILGRIGEGAHGIVFKAKHIQVACWYRN
jgi:hypothetical protein